MTLYRSSSPAITALGLALLVGCSTAPVTPTATTPLQPRSASEWLTLAQQADAATRASYQLNAARIYYDQGDLSSARKTAGGIDPAYLQGASIGEWLSLSAALIAQADGPGVAADWLQAPPQTLLLDKTTASGQVPVYLLLAELQNDAGRRLEAVATRLHVAPRLQDPAARTANQQAIWSSLMNVPPAQLSARIERLPAGQDTLRGWLELARIALDNQGYIDEQQARLAAWERAWPNHPARQPLPDDLALLKALSLDATTHIAVLLPAGGQLAQAGAALRDGIVAAYFDARERGAAVPPLAFYDTTAGVDIRSLYRQAVANGADLVIGPLSKERVKNLSTLSELTVPVLALNYTEEDYPTNDNFYQFGLSTGDDAIAAAQRAREKRYQRAMIIQDADGAGRRTAQAFMDAWKAADGEIGIVVDLESDRTASNDIRSGLHIDRSQQRARVVESVIRSKVEFTPRRRHDLDFAYLPISYQQARSVKPLLAFHFAHDLPVYASSRVYRGRVDQRSDSDLNGIVFTDTPWILGAAPRQYVRIERYVERGATPSKNLYALGIDAFNMVPRVSLMANSPSARFAGLTGSLRVSERGVIIRQPMWAVFQGGKATLMKDGEDDPAETEDPPLPTE